MKPHNKFIVGTGLIALAALFALRFFWNNFDPKSGLAFILAWGWSVPVTLGVLSDKDVSLSRSSPWRVLGLITNIYVGILTFFLLEPASFKNQDYSLLLLVFLAFTGVVCFIGWCRLFEVKIESYPSKITPRSKPIKKYSGESQASPVFLAIFFIVIIAVILVKKLGN